MHSFLFYFIFIQRLFYPSICVSRTSIIYAILYLFIWSLAINSIHSFQLLTPITLTSLITKITLSKPSFLHPFIRWLVPSFSAFFPSSLLHSSLYHSSTSPPHCFINLLPDSLIVNWSSCKSEHNQTNGKRWVT